jgi:proline dehydrogenase
VAWQSKRDVDAAYIELAERLLQKGEYPAFGTHDEKMIVALKEFAAKHKIEKSAFEFQLLYGIRRALQKKLKEEGYAVRVYVPYGVNWYPYFSRRLAERPANLFFFIKSLFRK